MYIRSIKRRLLILLTIIPSLTNLEEMAAPRPELAPVTTATLPTQRSIFTGLDIVIVRKRMLKAYKLSLMSQSRKYCTFI